MNLEILTNNTPLENVFWFCALVGTLFFVLRVIMMFMGADGGDGGSDFHGHGGDVGGDLGDMGHMSHSDVVFETISINSITAFIMMFGWTGLTCHKQFGMGTTISLVISLLIGILCMLITAYIFKLAKKLTSPGAEFDIKNTVGMNASVYQQIPAEGRGRININMPAMTRELDAVSEEKQEIASFNTVEVVRVVDNNTVSVKKVV